MSSRRRQGGRTRSSTSASTPFSLPSRPSGGRNTRHAAIANYAEPPSDEEALADEFDEDDDGEGINADVNGNANGSEDENDSDDSADSDSDEDDGDDENDPDFGAGRRSKRTLDADGRFLRSGPVKRRRLARQASAAASSSKISSKTSPRTSTKTTRSPPRASKQQPGRSNTTPRRRKSLTSFVVNDTAKQSPSKASRSNLSPAKGAGKDAVITKKLPWDRLPYMVMASIFDFASFPLDNVESSRWLAGACRISRSFTDAALRVLYRRPPLLSMSMAHGLLHMLTRKRAKHMYPYHHKIVTLSIDVELASTSYRGSRLDIGALVKQCPRLAHVNLYHNTDGPPYREFSANMRFSYPASLFKDLGIDLSPLSLPLSAGNGSSNGASAANNNSNANAVSDSESDVAGNTDDASPFSPAAARKNSLGISQDLIIDEPQRTTKLQSWRWNHRMFAAGWKSETIHELHQTETFAGLTKVTYVNFPRMSMYLPHPDPDHAAQLDKYNSSQVAATIMELSKLKHLVMKSCAVLDDVMLPMLPANLEHLELVSCNNVAAAPFAKFLETHGYSLRTLKLDHNRLLSLEFLTVLGTACPNLEELRMNLTYYSPLQFSGDSNPDYERLFSADQIPDWPKAIQAIELENLRKWDAPAAEMFFQSLVDSAPKIPHLRVLKLKAMLNIPWRHRSEIRDEWVRKLDRVFKRQPALPSPAYSMEHFKRFVSSRKLNKVPGAAEIDAIIEDVTVAKRLHDLEVLIEEKPPAQPAQPTQPARRSSRIPTAASSSSGPSLTSSLDRIASRRRISYREPDTDDDIAEEGQKEDEEEEDEEVEEEGDEGRGALPKCSIPLVSMRRPVLSVSSANSDDEEPEVVAVQRPFVHGMCDVVDVKFDNQKPVEVQYTMADFEDTEPESSDDDEWEE